MHVSAAREVPPGAGISLGDKSSAAPDDEADEAVATTGRRRKPLTFYMAFLCLLVMVFLCSMDSTIMAVSIPVSRSQLYHLRNMTTFTEANNRRLLPKNWGVLRLRPSGRASPSRSQSSSVFPHTPARRTSSAARSHSTHAMCCSWWDPSSSPPQTPWR